MQNVIPFKVPTMLTIKETAKATGVAEYFVRGLAVKNEIVHVRCGRKYLVNLEKFIEYLNSSKGECMSAEPENKYKIAQVQV